MSAHDKETTLYVRWSKREQDMMYHYPGSKADGHLVYGWFCADLWDRKSSPSSGDVFATCPILYELDKRGYDIKTLRFSVKKRSTP